MKATIWISGNRARIVVEDAEGRIIDHNEDWNNIASAQSWVYAEYPEAEFVVHRKEAQRKSDDERWNVCVLGN